jgi:RNA polymerase sigma factor (TIGR02999 family)
LSTPGPAQITQLLQQIGDGDDSAADELLPMIHGELRRLAEQAFAGQPRNQTLQPTALVNEAWLKLADRLGDFSGRKPFFIVAARAMRQVLADYARGRGREKRGGGRQAVTLDEVMGWTPDHSVNLVDLDDSLDKLGRLNERHARVVELRFFGSLTIPETADVLGVSTATVEADWNMARAWLRRELSTGSP